MKLYSRERCRGESPLSLLKHIRWPLRFTSTTQEPEAKRMLQNFGEASWGCLVRQALKISLHPTLVGTRLFNGLLIVLLLCSLPVRVAERHDSCLVSCGFALGPWGSIIRPSSISENSYMSLHLHLHRPALSTLALGLAIIQGMRMLAAGFGQCLGLQRSISTLHSVWKDLEGFSHLARARMRFLNYSY